MSFKDIPVRVASMCFGLRFILRTIGVASVTVDGMDHYFFSYYLL